MSATVLPHSPEMAPAPRRVAAACRAGIVAGIALSLASAPVAAQVPPPEQSATATDQAAPSAPAAGGGSRLAEKIAIGTSAVAASVIALQGLAGLFKKRAAAPPAGPAAVPATASVDGAQPGNEP